MEQPTTALELGSAYTGHTLTGTSGGAAQVSGPDSDPVQPVNPDLTLSRCGVRGAGETGPPKTKPKSSESIHSRMRADVPSRNIKNPAANPHLSSAHILVPHWSHTGSVVVASSWRMDAHGGRERGRDPRPFEKNTLVPASAAVWSPPSRSEGGHQTGRVGSGAESRLHGQQGRSGVKGQDLRMLEKQTTKSDPISFVSIVSEFLWALWEM